MEFEMPKSIGPNRMIPFGKYKGQPLEVLAADREYADWLMQQAWFQQKYPQFVHVIVNNLGEPSDSPSHNEMQMRFLDAEWREKFAALVEPDEFSRFVGEPQWISTVIEMVQCEFLNPPYPRRSENEIAVTSPGSFRMVSFDPQPAFECGKERVDVVVQQESIGMFCGNGRPPVVSFSLTDAKKYHIELKPTVGDNFPSVLRQMKSNGSRYLVYQECQATNVSVESIRKYFETQGIKAVSEAEIAATPIPSVEHFNLDTFVEAAEGLKPRIIKHGRA